MASPPSDPTHSTRQERAGAEASIRAEFDVGEWSSVAVRDARDKLARDKLAREIAGREVRAVCVCVCVRARARASNTQRSAPYILADALRCRGRAVRRITMRFASSHPTLIVIGPGSQDSEASQTLCARWEVA